MSLYFNVQALLAWFKEQKRDLPWREAPSPYAVWVSEVMLQQTQVDVVIPYYLRWMSAFPSIQDLAQADVEDVMKAWEGLGYYSRARNLHEGAKYIVDNYEGVLPCDAEKLDKIKGLGPYTIAAILNFAFQKKAAAVDGNVIRVLSRYYAITDDVTKGTTTKKIRAYLEEILPNERYWVFSEALIEIGALVCKKKPVCCQCPLMGSCQAYSEGLQESLPYKPKKIKYEALYRSVALIASGGEVLVKKAAAGEVMAGLHEFPYFETSKEGFASGGLKETLEKEWRVEVEAAQDLPEQRHSFTKYRVLLRPQYFKSSYFKAPMPYFWVPIKDLGKLAFSSGHKRVLNHFIGSKV